MTKTLTEQWRNGTLPENWYYIHLESKWGNIDYITINYCDEDGVFEEYPDEDIKEVLAPVPSYDEYNELATKCSQLEEDVKILKKKLEIATKALEYYTLEDAYVSCCGNPVNSNPMVARKALKEMEGVK